MKKSIIASASLLSLVAFASPVKAEWVTVSSSEAAIVEIDSREITRKANQVVYMVRYHFAQVSENGMKFALMVESADCDRATFKRAGVFALNSDFKKIGQEIGETEEKPVTGPIQKSILEAACQAPISNAGESTVR
jgi:hypothetical protein